MPATRSTAPSNPPPLTITKPRSAAVQNGVFLFVFVPARSACSHLKSTSQWSGPQTGSLTKRLAMLEPPNQVLNPFSSHQAAGREHCKQVTPLALSRFLRRAKAGACKNRSAAPSTPRCFVHWTRFGVLAFLPEKEVSGRGHRRRRGFCRRPCRRNRRAGRRGDRQTHRRGADGVRGIHRPWEAGVREAGGADGNDDVPSRTRIRRRGAEAEARHEDRGVPGASKC